MAAKRSERRQRTDLAVVRLYPDEHQALKRAAADRGVSVGELIRAALRGAGWEAR